MKIKVIVEAGQNKRFSMEKQCAISELEQEMGCITKEMKRELRFADLYIRIERQKCMLNSARISYDVLFLTPEAAEWLNDEYNWLLGNPKGEIAKYQGLQVMVIPELKEDFMIGVKDA